MEGIERRMKKITQHYLLPAGYELQKVVTYFERLSQGKDLFDQGALSKLANCADNNKRYDLLQRIAKALDGAAATLISRTASEWKP
jgi:hypothetical protein